MIQPPSVIPMCLADEAGGDRIDALSRRLASTPVDTVTIPQASLDLSARERTSLFPWRGQFSPQFVELLLAHHAKPGSVVVDPFVGSGTTLFEAVRGGMECYGGEINRAAFHFASLSRFGSLSKDARRVERRAVECVFEEQFGPLLPSNLYRRRVGTGNDLAPEAALRAALKTLHSDGLAHHVLAVAVLLAMGDGPDLRAGTVDDSLSRVWQTVDKIPFSPHACHVRLQDARRLSVPTGAADIVITSPPYINVFNYHQNHRKAVELMGFDVLRGAASEMGANRKFRQNRILTIVQYALDMAGALTEMRRVLKSSGVAVLVVGRESRVCGLPIRNGQLLALLAVGGAGFRLSRWQERQFTSRFGERIWEDIITLVPDSTALPNDAAFARSVALWVLRKLPPDVPDPVGALIRGAIERAYQVEPSPILGVVPDAA